MNSNQIRSTFLNYFKKNGHEVIHSSSLVPDNDPTLMFANSGMVQFKNFFTGKKKPIDKNIVTIQKCIRAGGKHNDLDNIGLIINKNDFTLNSLLKKNIDFKTCLFKSDNPLINQSELIKSFDKNLYDEVLNNNKQISFAENDEELMEWILKFKIKNLIIPYESQGKYILNKKNILNKFTNKNVNVFFYLREWDRLAFPFAKKGFFPFKNKIPELLKKQGLVN